MKRPGRKFKDCDECPTMVVLPPVNGVSIAEASSSLSSSEWEFVMGEAVAGYLDYSNYLVRFQSGGASPWKIPRGAIDKFIKKLNAKTGKNYYLQLKNVDKSQQEVLDYPNRYPAGLGNGIGYMAGIIIARTLP